MFYIILNLHVCNLSMIVPLTGGPVVNLCMFIQTNTTQMPKNAASVFNKIKCVSEGIIFPFKMFEQKRF